MSCPSYSSWFDHPSNICWWVQSMRGAGVNVNCLSVCLSVRF
jgi:hypothetical protein